MNTDLNREKKEPTFFEFKNINHKFYFAAYCNMALQNTGKVLNSILSILGRDEKTTEFENELSEHSIVNLLKDSKDPNLQTSILDLLERHLPFILEGSEEWTMEQSSPQSIGVRLKAYIKMLISFRNYYSHYVPKTEFSSIESKLENKRAFFDILKAIKEKAITASEKRLDLDTKKGYAKSTNERVSRRELKVYRTFKKKFKKTDSFDEDTFLFFLSLFLTKKETTELLNHIKGKKSTTHAQYRWVRNIFLVINAKNFQNKIKSTDPKDALSLNLLNELSRFPIQLSKYLTDKGQQNLIVKENIISDSTLTDKQEDKQNTIKLLRYGDSFAYNALQFLEHNDLLPKMRFQLHLGKVFSHKPYTKKIGKYEGKRELTKDLLVHGRLKDYDDSFYKEYIKREEEKEPEFAEPLKYYRPKYHFKGHKIKCTKKG